MATINRSDVVGRRVRLPGHFAEPVVIEDVEDPGFGDVLIVKVRTTRGKLEEASVDAAVLAAALAAATTTAPTYINPEDQFLLVESARIRLAYAWDPFFAVSLSGIEALPHQLEAVYDRMLQQARLRFLLADDPGAGKTIMAGLLFKELRLRGAVERALILAPAPLAIQWQDEMRSKFDEVFELIDSHAARQQLGGSPWSRFPLCVASIDFAKQDHVAPELLRERWDLVVIDEAHKLAMPDIEKPTFRYKLARDLAERTERLVLLTATPHQGNPEQFRNFVSLLDPYAFRDEDVIRDLLQQQKSPWFLRRMKEDLRDFAGKPLFVDRHAVTEPFQLTDVEYSLYTAVSRYINTFLPRQKGRRKATAALARMVLQRRLSSSLRAIRTSVERRLEKITGIVEELDKLPEEARTRRLRELANLPVDPETGTDDEADEALDEAAESGILAEHFDKLRAEVPELVRLVEQARIAEARSREKGHESKLSALFRCLEKSQFQELREKSGKLLIFTEHRATLEYLEEHLTKAGFTCCHIHGGMDAVARKEAQRLFQSEKQICVATEAAGEGINLQFCHLMINYDIPWNPNRLDQRMGRIHRFGQTREVHVYNFVAVGGPKGPDEQPVVEGRILECLFRKIEEMKKTLGDRVFDMIGLVLQRNGVGLEDMLRDAAWNPRLLDDYTDRISRMSPEKAQEYERSTGIALAKSTVDLGRIRGQDFASEEKRLMPEFVEGFFLDAAKKTGLRVEKRANPLLLRIEHVPQKFLARDLAAVRARGPAEQRYLKASFHKAELAKVDNLDGCLVSPGHPLYAALDEVLRRDLRGVEQGTARYVDPFASDPHRLHFFEVEIEGESLGDPGQPARTLPVHAALVAVQEEPGPTFSLAQPDVLHDLTPMDPAKLFPPTEPWSGPPTPEEVRKITGWLRVTEQHATVQRLQKERQREVEIRREFLSRAFEASIKATQVQWAELHARVMAGEGEAKLARDEKAKYLAELEAAKKHRLEGLAHLAVVRSGRIAHLGSAIVAPAPTPAGAAMQRDDAVEQAAIDVAIAYERRRGWEIKEVWKLHDGSGFDLRSVSPAGPDGRREVRRIEVKGRAADGVDVHLSPNEWRQAQRLRDTYWLYVVWGAKGLTPRLKAIRDPWETFREQAREVVEVKGYRIAGEALTAVTGEEWAT